MPIRALVRPDVANQTIEDAVATMASASRRAVDARLAFAAAEQTLAQAKDELNEANRELERARSELVFIATGSDVFHALNELWQYAEWRK